MRVVLASQESRMLPGPFAARTILCDPHRQLNGRWQTISSLLQLIEHRTDRRMISTIEEWFPFARKVRPARQVVVDTRAMKQRVSTMKDRPHNGEPIGLWSQIRQQLTNLD